MIKVITNQLNLVILTYKHNVGTAFGGGIHFKLVNKQGWGRGVTVKKKQHGVSRVFMNAILKTRLHVDFGKQMRLRFENLRFHGHWATKRNPAALQSRGRNFPYSFPSKTAKTTSILKLAKRAC